MPSQLLEGNLTDQNGVPVVGAKVFVYGMTGALAVAQPALSGEDGYWSVQVPDEGFYTLHHHWAGRVRLIEANVVAGREPLSIVKTGADTVQATANYRVSKVAGEAATAVGGLFSYPDGVGGVIYAERTANGGGDAGGNSKEIARAITRQYGGELTSSGGDGARYRASLGDDIDGGGKNNRADFLISRARNAWTANHGGSGAPYPYIDQVAAFGVNLLANASRPNPQNSGVAWFVEPKFYQGGVFANELQLRFYGLDNVERRPIQFFLPEGGAGVRGVANVQFQVDAFRLHDWADNQVVDWNLQTKVFNYVAGVAHVFSGNNAPFMRQINAAGTVFVPLPYLDSQDFLRTESPTVHVVTPKAHPDFGVTAGKIVLVQNPPAGSRGERWSYTGLTGSYTCVEHEAATAANVAIEHLIRNSDAGDAFWHAKADGGGKAGFKVNGQQVVGARGAPIADVPMAAGAPTKAEYDALATAFNTLLARLRPTAGHGMIGA